MPAKALKARFAAPAAKDPEPQDAAAEIWSGQEQGRHARSYDLLSDALMAIFERIYLPLAVMDRNPETGGLRYTEAGLARFEQLKDRYVVSLRNNEPAVQLEVEISPAPLYKGLFNTGIADPYLSGPEEIRDTITTFFTELNEIAAGLPGVGVNPSAHILTFNGPQAFHDMITALCDAKGIVTAEHDHTAYALASRPSCDDAKAPGPCTCPLPDPVMRALSPQHYSWAEINHMVNRYNDQGLVPLFSLRTLQAAVDQDLGAEAIRPRPAIYYLH